MQARVQQFNAKARTLVRSELAKHVGIPVLKVAIERVARLPRKDASAGIEVTIVIYLDDRPEFGLPLIDKLKVP
jgi:hypothetical protein